MKIFNLKAETITPLYTGEVRELEREIARSKKINFPVRKTRTGKVLIPLKGQLRHTLEVIRKDLDVCIMPPENETGFFGRKNVKGKTR